MYSELKRTVPNIEFIQGINPKEANASYPRLYVFDDLMRHATKDGDICEMYTEGSHHRNLSVVCLLQNLYYRGKENRTMNLNSQYIVLFKNPRDRQQIATLARQMYPHNWQHFMRVFQEATRRPYGHLLIDLKQDTPDDQRLWPNVIKEKPDPLSNNCITNDKISNMEGHSCIDCGALFASDMDVTRHRKGACPEEEEPACKKFKTETNWVKLKDDESDWTDLLNSESDSDDDWTDLVDEVYNTNKDDFQAKVDAYLEQGLSEKKAESKAAHRLLDSDAKTLAENYQYLISAMYSLRCSSLHHSILTDIQKYTEQGIDFRKALKKAVGKHVNSLRDLVQRQESNTSSGSEDESLESEQTDQTDEDTDTSSQEESDSDAEVPKRLPPPGYIRSDY